MRGLFTKDDPLLFPIYRGTPVLTLLFSDLVSSRWQLHYFSLHKLYPPRVQWPFHSKLANWTGVNTNNTTSDENQIRSLRFKLQSAYLVCTQKSSRAEQYFQFFISLTCLLEIIKISLRIKSQSHLAKPPKPRQKKTGRTLLIISMTMPYLQHLFMVICLKITISILSVACSIFYP